MMKSLVLGLVVLFFAAASGAAETRDSAAFFDDSFGDLQEELNNARDQEKKGVLIMFEMDECPFCHRMKQTVLNRADVQDYFREHFIILSIDTEGDLEITDFQGNTTTQKDFALKQFRVRATPVFQFVDLDGTPSRRGRFTGATRDAEEFLLFGEFLVDDHFNETSFSKFKKDKRSS